MPELLIVAITSALLYTLTYLALLRNLAYPRNWLPPPKTGLAAVGMLAMATVVYTALTPLGFSLHQALVTTMALFILGICIAAPALGFKPGLAGPVLRWLALRASYMGSVVAGALVALSLWVESHGFESLAVTALVFELAWSGVCWRDWWRRVDVELDAADVSVLHAQSGGDLHAFARHYALRELRVGALGRPTWRGCTRQTQPCAFNHHALQLGLNAAPCCRQQLRAMCVSVVSGLERLGFTCWLDGGTLLGAAREGDLLAWEDDIDIAALLDDDRSWAQFAASASAVCRDLGLHVERFDAHEFMTASQGAPGPWPWPVSLQRNRTRGELRVDLVAYHSRTAAAGQQLCRATPKGNLPRLAGAGYAIPYTWIVPLVRIELAGHDVPAPARTDDYLTLMYGNWRAVRYLYMDAAAAARRPDGGVGPASATARG